MLFIRSIFVLFILPFVEQTVYIEHTEDGSSIEFYDCIDHNDLLYCRRPSEPISLERDNLARHCYHNGTVHSFSTLRSKNVSVNTILHKWKSSIERAEQYARFLGLLNSNDQYLCQCTHSQSFGKNCEYLFPKEKTFEKTLDWQVKMRNDHPWEVQMYGDIVCYNTLKCDYGLLCLDWRDICDGVQQCMAGMDEENCDKLEFNECEYDEYRCMNGMCVPDEYFLDFEFDCMDRSDEMGWHSRSDCGELQVQTQCDDQTCLPGEFSCGDGQCIVNRFRFQEQSSPSTECKSRREQYYMCEMHVNVGMWTLPNGRCYVAHKYEEVRDSSRDECIYHLKCTLSRGAEKKCTCQKLSDCTALLNQVCSLQMIQYPNGGIIAPYMFYFYNISHKLDSYMPSFIRLNGTIKCRGFMALFDTELNANEFGHGLRDVEAWLCQHLSHSSVLDNSGYDKFCHNESQTFTNHTYNIIDVCNESKECISVYRIHDGLENCVDKMDEQQGALVLKTCEQVKRHRFRCSAEELTCLSVISIADLVPDCKNEYDERWMGTKKTLSNMHCYLSTRSECRFIRQYIEDSWTLNNNSRYISQLQIPFRAHCNTVWDFGSQENENVAMCRQWWVCPRYEWQCRTGQCIHVDWVLDGEWDCTDASDEEALFAFQQRVPDRNLQLIELSELKRLFTKLYKYQPFSTICNTSIEYPCIRINVSNPFDNMILNRPCISFLQIGDGHIDCIGGVDERNTVKHCDQSAMLGYNFKCSLSETCIPYLSLCKDRCPQMSEDGYWCNRQQNRSNCSTSDSFVCLDGKCTKKGRCSKLLHCAHGEDEYMCHRSIDGVDEFYREDKENNVEYSMPTLDLPKYPDGIGATRYTNAKTRAYIATTAAPVYNKSSTIPYECNRGVGVQMYNGSIACFCPPQYYGDKCQFHNDRITVLLHLNLSQSIYTEDSDPMIVLKLLVLFLFKNQMLMSHEFHVRPTAEIKFYTKHMLHFVYSRSSEFLHHKMARYLNRSNIINEHPYSIRIEGYELKQNEKVKLIAVWQYPIYFDYLPVFRLAKVLQLIKSQNIHNPCSNYRCNQNQECQPILNDKSKYICLCKSGYMGENCWLRDQNCATSYCSSKALCNSNYRALLTSNPMPLCICPYDRHGHRCELLHSVCLSHPCKNGGTCLPIKKLNQFECVCTDEYTGNQCTEKKFEVKLYINKSIKHTGAVVQHFKIGFNPLRLIPVHQEVYSILRISLEHYYSKETWSEITLVKSYTSHSNAQPKIHLIFLHNDVISINATIQLNERNYCAPIHTLFPSTEEISPFKYHHLCQNNTSLFCFYDNFNLCICSDSYTRAECFEYDHTLDHCSRCRNGGRCLQGDRFKWSNFICMCPRCFHGLMCEFDSQYLSFTLDSLIVKDELPVQTVYITIVSILFLFGLLTNLCSLSTFARPKPREIGVGNYLYIVTLLNEASLMLLLLKVVHIYIGSSHLLITQPNVNIILCRTLSYLLSVFTRANNWLLSWVTMERVSLIIFPAMTVFDKPKVAIIISIITLVTIFGAHVHELLFYTIVQDPTGKTLCTSDYSQSGVAIFNRVNVLVHYLVPFVIQVVSTTLIIVLATQSRAKTAGQNETFKQILKKQFFKQKELYITPAMIALSALPHIIFSFSFACQDPSLWQRYTLLATYFFAYMPQGLGFILFVLPSTGYVKELRKTRFGTIFMTKR